MDKLYEFIGEHLGVKKPWIVSDVYTAEDSRGYAEDHINIEVPKGTLVECPACGKTCKVHDRPNTRVWRDLDAFGRKVYVHAKIPRADCPDCGVKQIKVPWAREGSGFTLRMEEQMMALIKEMSVTSAARYLGETSPRVWRVVNYYADKFVREIDLSSVTKVGVDEKCFSGYDGFITVFVDLDTNKIIHVAEGKDSSTIQKFKEFLILHHGDHKAVTDFSCDFGSAYISGIKKHFHKARITGDRFHLIKMANAALNKTKCSEFKLSVSRMKANYILLRNSNNLSEESIILRNRICDDNEKLGLAYRLKESLSALYNMGDEETGRLHLTDWIRWARVSKLPRFVKLADTVEKHTEHILSWFITGLNNAVLEGMNSLISVIKSRARGFRTVDNLIDMCYLVGARDDLDMYGRSL